MLLRQRGHSFISGAGCGAGSKRALNRTYGTTTKKYMTTAMIRKAITTLTKSPYGNLLLLIVKERPEKSGLPKRAAINGVIRSLTKAVTSVPKAIPTARSTRLPRSRNVLKPLAMPLSLHLQTDLLTQLETQAHTCRASRLDHRLTPRSPGSSPHPCARRAPL